MLNEKNIVTFSPEQISCVNWLHFTFPKFLQFLLFSSKLVNHYRNTNENSRNWKLWKFYQSVHPSRIISVSGGCRKWRHFSVKTKAERIGMIFVYISREVYFIYWLRYIFMIQLAITSSQYGFEQFWNGKNIFFSRQINCDLILYICVVLT